MELKVQLLSKSATLPVRATTNSAGYDLFSAIDYVISHWNKGLIPTDIAIAIPEGHYGRIAPRSGLAYKNSIHTMAGVIDADYRGNIGVILFNLSDNAFKVNKGDRIAQLILEKISTPEIVVVTNLDDTERGVGGFGSTGTT